jgi:molybdopterin-guanine dinucleotide biosynthesis protein A
MGNVDKGLELLDGRPLVTWVIQCLAPQVGEILVSANRNRDVYAGLGYRVVEDLVGGFAGPLAGLHRGLAEAEHELVISVPCDTPFLPRDLVARLSMPLEDRNVDLSVAKTGNQPHPVICLAHKRLLPHLAAYLDRGGRKFDAWYSTLNVSEVRFDDAPRAFSNINTIEELRCSERALKN